MRTLILVGAVVIAVGGTMICLALDARAGEPDLSKHSLGFLPYDSYTAGRALNGSRNPMPGEQPPPAVRTYTFAHPPVYYRPYPVYYPHGNCSGHGHGYVTSRRTSYGNYPGSFHRPPRYVPHPPVMYGSRTIIYRSPGMTIMLNR